MPDQLVGSEFTVQLSEHPYQQGRLGGYLPIPSNMGFIVRIEDTGKAKAGEVRTVLVLKTKRKVWGHYAIVALV